MWEIEINWLNNKFLEFRLSTMSSSWSLLLSLKSRSHMISSSRISHGPKLHTLACYLTATPTKDDRAKTLTIFLATTFLMATFSSSKPIFTSCCRRWTRRRWRTRWRGWAGTARTCPTARSLPACKTSRWSGLVILQGHSQPGGNDLGQGEKETVNFHLKFGIQTRLNVASQIWGHHK